MNKVILIGNLTRDPESHMTASGRSCTTFSIAVNRRFVDRQSGKREVDYFNVVTWQQTADACARYLARGRKVCVIGPVQMRTYTAQDGTKRTITEVIADEVEFLGPVHDRGDAYEEHGNSSAGSLSTSNARNSFDELPDELPF